jgi:putative ABC transport system permease protein
MRFERWRNIVSLRWRSLARRRAVERDLDDEIRDHLESQIEALVARGVPPEVAERDVRARFGALDLAKEQCRDAWHMQLVDTLVTDLRYTARTLWNSPGFATVAILTLALGIGANSAVFSLVDTILIARLPYPGSDRLVSIAGTYPGGAFAAMRDEVRTMDVAVYAEGHRFTVSGRGQPVSITGARVSTELFSLLGVEPALGRWPRRREDEAPGDRIVVLSHGLWRRHFGGDPAVVGRSIDVDGIAREIVAVMPATFTFPSSRTQAWVPLGLDPRDTPRYWAGDFMPAIGRLRSQASIEAAHAEVRALQPRIAARFPWTMPASWNQDVAVVPLHSAVVGDVRPRLLLLVTGVGLVLAIACANVANLALSRAAAREREIAVRTAMGATPQRLARQLLTECIALSACGAALGVLLATQGLALLKRVLPADTPRLDEAALNWRVLAFTGALAVLTGCAFGLAPVLQARRLRLRSSLDAGGRGGGRAVGGRFRRALTVAQIACAVMLVIAAALLIRSLRSLSTVDPGFESREIVTARISPTPEVCAVPERCLTFYRSFEQAVEAAPGVTSAALINTLPLTGAIAKRSLQLEGFTPEARQGAPLFWLTIVSPKYFEVMGIRLDAGRAFTSADRAGPAVAIVSTATARQFWPRENPIGRHVRFVGETGWRTIVGIAADVRGFDLTKSAPEFIAGVVYVPYRMSATMEDGRIPTDMVLAVRTRQSIASIESLARTAAAAAGGEVALSDVRRMDDVIAATVAAPSAITSLLGAMAALAVTLGCIGVYGVLSFLVSRQTREFGIRLALGAQPRDVVWLVLREGATLCAAGIAIGVAGAAGASRWLRSELHGVTATDPATYIGVALAVSAVTLVACYVPTRRAMRVDPLIVLRNS